MNFAAIPKAAFDSKLLNKEFHERLLGDLPQIASTAGVPEHAVWMPLSEYTTKEEYEWVRQWRALPDSGLVFLGSGYDIPVDTKMTAIVGACLRNYIDARLMTVQDVIRRLKDGVMPYPTLLLIPNFFLDVKNGGSIPDWESSHLMGLLLQRNTMGLKTVLGVSPSLAALKKGYGPAFSTHLEGKYSTATEHGVSVFKAKAGGAA